MKLRFLQFIAPSAMALPWILMGPFAHTACARDILLNGQDISSARNQEMKGVNLRIDDKGNIFVDAPHYKVHEEDTYAPLGRFIRDAAKESALSPTHLQPQSMNQSGKNAAATSPPEKDMVPASPEIPDLTAEAPTGALSAPSTDKAGTKVPKERKLARKSPADNSSSESKGEVIPATELKDPETSPNKLPLEKVGDRAPPGGPAESPAAIPEENTGNQ